MPLSKKRMRERKRLDRMSNLNTMPIVAYASDGGVFKTQVISPFVKPNVKLRFGDHAKPNNEFRWQDQGKQPIPNRPDGRYRDKGG